MPSTYTSNNALTLQAFNENPNSWGSILNTVLGLIDSSLDGIEAVDVTGSSPTATLTIADGASAQARSRVLNFTGARTVTNITVTIGPNTVEKIYWVKNSTTGGFSVILAQGSGSTVTIAPGAWALVFLDGAGSGAGVTTLTSFAMAGSSSGITVLQPSAVASGTLTLPAATDTLVGRATTDTLSNKTLATPTITTNATVPLVIGGTGTTSTLALRSTSGAGTTGADIVFQAGNNGATEVMRLQNNGFAGLGTAVIATKLDIRGTSATTGSTVQIVGIGVSSLMLGQDADGGVIRGQGGNSTLRFLVGGAGDNAAAAAGTEAMRINSSANVGINSPNPGSRLTVSDPNKAVDSTGNVTIFTTNAQAANFGGSLGLGGLNGSAGAFDPWSFATIKGAKENGTSGNFAGYFSVAVSSSGGVLSERMRIDSSGNVKVGGTADRATTAGTNQVVIFNGTAPVGTLANGCSFYSTAGEMRVMDAAGNATLLSPHDSQTNEWIYDSTHTPTGKRLKISVEKLLRFVNDHFGLDCVMEEE